MRYILSAITLVALVLTGTAAQAAADAPLARRLDTPHCVTKHEYKKAHKHLWMRKVHRIFDTLGKVAYHGAGGVGRRYRFCKHAAHRAHTHHFVAVYITYPKPNKLYRKYCGRNATHSHPCF